MGMRHGETKVAGDKAFARIRKHGRRGPFGRRSASKSLCAVLAAAMLVFARAGLYGCSASGGSSDRTPVRLQIFAANSLSGAMAEATAAYSQTHSWVSFADTQFLSSGDLAMQLRVGAYADVIISASSDKMDIVESFGGIKEGTRFNLFDNNLILVTRKGSEITADTLEEAIGKGYSICIGDETVPAGNYARQVLYSLGAYTKPEGQGGFYVGIAPLLDSSVGNVCKHVETGDADIGIVYSSDIYRFENLDTICSISEGACDNIVYPAAICSISDNEAAAQEFLTWCRSDATAVAIWQRWGFEMSR